MRPRRDRQGWRIGVDLGGTWLRVAALDPRGRRRLVKQPSPGLDGLPGRLASLWRGWGLERRRVASLVVASRGVWTATERRRHTHRLRDLAVSVEVISDVEAAYVGALGDRAGVLLLAGTGSMALARDGRGGWLRAGGLGPLLGDEGSAFWIGRQWLRTTLDEGGFARARRILARPDPVARIAGLAPDVLHRARAGHTAARRIVSAAQAALADLVADAARRLRETAPIPISWSGGLLQDERFRSGVWRAVRRRGLRITPQAPRDDALAAVARMAARRGAMRPSSK